MRLFSRETEDLNKENLMPTTFLIHFNALSSHLSELEAALQLACTNLPQVKGCQSALLLQNADDPCRLTMIEKWEDRRDHQAHVESMIATGAWAQITSLLRELPHSGYYQSI